MKIYPAHIEGRFRTRKNLISVVLQFILFATPWLSWNGRPVVMVDLAGRKLHLMGATFWPQETHFMLLGLLAAGLTLFLVSSVLGRVWCGFACPHTLLTHSFIMVERLIEGPAYQRKRRDAKGWREKGPRKLLTWSVWLVMSLYLGLTFSGYFQPIREVVVELAQGRATPFAVQLILFFTAVSLSFFGVIRSHFCTTICPYARFQSALTNQDTIMVNYDHKRGEPRGRVKDPKAADCVDCSACVRVCPMGIDIRDGFQFACINCAACIDACDEVMDRVDRPAGLIRFASLAEVEESRGTPSWRERLGAYGVRPLIYLTLLFGLGALTTVLVWQRPPFDFQVVREVSQGGMGQAFDGRSINRYDLRIVNRTAEARTVGISAEAEGVTIEVVTAHNPVLLEPESVHTVPVMVVLEPAEAGEATSSGGRSPLRSEALSFTVESGDVARTKQTTLITQIRAGGTP